MTDPNEDRLVDINEAMRILGVSRSTLRKLEMLPAPDPMKLPRRVYITPQCPRWSYLALQEYVAQIRKRATTFATTPEEGNEGSVENAA